MALPNFVLWCWVITWTTCNCAPLQTNITGRSGSTPCIGDTVTYTCTVNSVGHAWRSSAFVIPSIGISRGIPTVTDPGTGFNFALVPGADAPNPIISALTLTASPQLNGANITCADLLANPGVEDQTITVTMFDSPSAPELALAGQIDLSSLNFTLTPPDTSAQCVTDYTINATSSSGSRIITVPEAGPVTVGGLNLCAETYNFTAHVVSGAGNGNASASVVQDAIDPDLVVLQPNINAVSSSSQVTVSWQDDTAGLNVTIGYSSGGSCSGAGVTVDGDLSMQQVVALDCTDCNGRDVTFTVQYIARSGCSSMTSTATVSIVDGSCPNATDPTTAPTTTPSETGTTDSEVSSPLGGIVGGVLSALVAVSVVVIIFVVYFVVCKKKKDCSGDGVNCSSNTKVPYHSSGPSSRLASVEMADSAGVGAMYADPKAIEHEAAGPTGDEYALVSTNTKAKKKAPQPEVTVETGDMYSVPDKTKKKQNQTQGLVYADIDLGRPQPPPPNTHHVVQYQPNEEPVTYATVSGV